MPLQEPWPEGYTINARSPYGWRKHPITGRKTFHHGVDVALPVGTPLTAPADGVVVHKGNGASGGVTLILEHPGKLFTVYYHLQKPSHLAKGATVKLGELIAYSGNTGASTGPHLHWEVRTPTRQWGRTVDPVDYLQETVQPPEPAPVEPVEPEPVQPVEPPAEETTPKRRIPTPLSPRLQAFFNFRRNLR